MQYFKSSLHSSMSSTAVTCLGNNPRGAKEMSDCEQEASFYMETLSHNICRWRALHRISSFHSVIRRSGKPIGRGARSRISRLKFELALFLRFGRLLLCGLFFFRSRSYVNCGLRIDLDQRARVGIRGRIVARDAPGHLVFGAVFLDGQESVR